MFKRYTFFIHHGREYSNCNVECLEVLSMLWLWCVLMPVSLGSFKPWPGGDRHTAWLRAMRTLFQPIRSAASQPVTCQSHKQPIKLTYFTSALIFILISHHTAVQSRSAAHHLDLAKSTVIHKLNSLFSIFRMNSTFLQGWSDEKFKKS